MRGRRRGVELGGRQLRVRLAARGSHHTHRRVLLPWSAFGAFTLRSHPDSLRLTLHSCVNTVQAGGPVECILVFAPWLFAGTAATKAFAAGGVDKQCAHARSQKHRVPCALWSRAQLATRVVL